MDAATPGLGRIWHPDPRDLNHLARRVMRPLLGPRHDQEWGYRFPPLDQKATGTCVGHGWKEYLLCEPNPETTPRSKPTAFQIYDAAIKKDEFKENDRDYKRVMGTSVRAGAKALSDLGYIGEDKQYVWGFDVDTVVDWLVNHGPVVIGISWKKSMFRTDDAGVLGDERASGDAGGHCVCLNGWLESRGMAMGLQSWGASYGAKLPSGGRNGRFLMPGEMLDRRIKDNGEACMIAKVPRF
jgi:hypothetical protein